MKFPNKMLLLAFFSLLFLSAPLISQAADFQPPRVKRVVDGATLLLTNGDRFCGGGEKLSQSGLEANSGDWAGRVEGNWMNQRLEVNWEYQKYKVKC